jgi:hypothetical protein
VREEKENGSQPDQKRSWIAWAIGIVAGLALAGGVAWFVLTQGGVTPSPPGTPPVPPRTPFAFVAPKLNVTSYTGKISPQAAEKAAEEIRTELSTLYDRAFVDPATWTNGLPPETWEAFDPRAAARAQKDAAAFGLGRVEGLEELEVTESSLVVSVLEDPGRRPLSALAKVEFEATGALEGGSTLQVRNRAAYLLRQVRGRWLIVGFPSLRTKVDSVPPPIPAEGPSPGPTPSADRTGGSG